MNILMLVLLAAALAACGAWAVIHAGRRRFDELVASEVRELFSSAPPCARPRPDLPEPICRYLSYAISEGAPAIATARLQHDGFFRPKPGPWMPIRGEQYFTAAHPGFVWHATVKAAPLTWIEARDCLISGRGNMLVKLWSVLPIADVRGPEIDQGALLRWLAETVWFPYALAGDTVKWQAIDYHLARATLACERACEQPVSAVVEVDEEGRLIQVSASRYYDTGRGAAVLRPWKGRCSHYHQFDGFRVPTSVEASWLLPEGEFAYARFHVMALEYNVPARW